MSKKYLQWHPAFQAALRIELQKDQDMLTFLEEYPLSKKPLQIDVVILKNETDQAMRASMGQLFLKHNIVEYKSPEDYFSINDFYKLLSYACLYQSETENVMEILPEEVTLTVAVSHYPRQLIHHLKERYHSQVTERFPGIYYVTGVMFPMQILVIPRLSKEEYAWLGRLRTDLRVDEDIGVLAELYQEKGKDRFSSAVMDVIIQANWEQYEEGRDMCEALRLLFADELRESRQAGIETGIRTGIQTGKEMVNSLNCLLAGQGRTDDILLSMGDAEYQTRLFQEFNLM